MAEIIIQLSQTMHIDVRWGGYGECAEFPTWDLKVRKFTHQAAFGGYKAACRVPELAATHHILVIRHASNAVGSHGIRSEVVRR